ncbi:hypothetical protein A8A54_04480 [Brucella pseudogrignonensis]|uniref:P-loop ATPase, Sll1717 family n=1 Tax=Brucella pseudogrignonensis TaxID=419475 RepID=UPI0007DA7F28|nr:hypothetical protein [Brucella pseudogrignonensis]ANG95808.1 hypothetical protein A8A54_04480 [Brucella pseudogrignonensis]
MKSFFAYPSSQKEVISVIHLAKDLLVSSGAQIEIHLWEENEICGRVLTSPIFDGIRQSDFLIADITSLNFNVTFEIGYAIGIGKRVYLVRNNNFHRTGGLIDKIGIFDTLGFVGYSDQNELSNLIRTFGNDNPIPLRGTINTRTPVYILRTPQSNSAQIAITSRVKKARLGFKGYMPSDDARLSASGAIDDISACIGAIIPLLPNEFADAEVHNIRAAFTSGLALGMGKLTAILQPHGGPSPLDVRDIVKTFGNEEALADFIGEFALDVTERLQSDDPLPLPKGNFLAELSIGDPVAENEFQTLGSYYLRTDQFQRASRGEVNLVVGRKGAGKTALFSQLRNTKRNNVQNIVVDLKPEGYQLLRLKEDVLDYLAEGARMHLITALFEYVFYLEICYKLLEKDRSKHLRDNKLYDLYYNLSEIYQSGAAGEGDFSERLQGISRDLANSFQKKFGDSSDQRLTSSQVTELIYKHNLRDIRKALSDYLSVKEGVWVLFDNLDKGWSSHGLTDDDILIVRGLIDAARKIQRQMQSDGHDFHCVVFVRNDVYQLLVEASADYGKESRATLDWTDSDLLREMLRRRLIHGTLPESTPFERVWAEICISHYKGEETSQFLIDRSLMRPRNLIKLLGHCRGFAVGMGRARIEEIDFEKGLKAYSLDLITEADQELTDILGRDTNLIYHFIGEGENFARTKLEEILLGADISQSELAQVISFMLYYGFLGVKVGDNSPKFIFDVAYDMKLLEVLISKAKGGMVFILNPAFHAGLNF